MKKSQTLPASIKPSAIHKKRGKLSHLSPRSRLSHGKRSISSVTGLSISSSTPIQPTPSPSHRSSMANSSTNTTSMQSPILAGSSASPAFSGNKQRDIPSASNSLEDNNDDNIEVVMSSNGNVGDGSWSQVMTGSDEVDLGSANSLDSNRTKAAIDHTQQKINRTKEMIKSEQTSRDENVNEYLKLANSCSDKLQLQRIKSVFEKKNQKSAQTIAQLQKKLETYTKKIQDLERNGISNQHHHRQPKGVLRDVSQGLSGVVGNIKGSLSAATHSAAETVMSKPREFAHLIKNKFGSADNISSMSKTGEDGEDVEPIHHGSGTFTHSTKYTSDDECSSITSGSAGPVAVTTNSASPGHHQDAPVSPSFSSLPAVNIPEPTNEMLVSLWAEIHERREENHRISDELESTKAQMQHDYNLFNQALQDERYRYERLEEQMNDLIELHQNEIENLKTGISDMEEKVQYQSEERLNDLHELMESCQTRISRMEHQQQQHQQLVSIEGIENSNARALVLKLVNIVLTLLQVILLLVSTLANIIMPFLKTRVRTLTTVLLVVIAVLVFRQWTEIVDHGHRLLS